MLTAPKKFKSLFKRNIKPLLVKEESQSKNGGGKKENKKSKPNKNSKKT